MLCKPKNNLGDTMASEDITLDNTLKLEDVRHKIAELIHSNLDITV
jgi:hypothetical protein